MAAAAVLPDGKIKRGALRRLGGWDIHPTARVGSVLALNVRNVRRVSNG